MYKAKDIRGRPSIRRNSLIADGGYGHTSSMLSQRCNRAGKARRSSPTRMKTCRIIVNTPSSQGGIGDLYNFKLAPSLTLGCGSWGGNCVSRTSESNTSSTSRLSPRGERTCLWFRAPEKVYIKKGCLPVALDELKHVMGKKRAFIVTDSLPVSTTATPNRSPTSSTRWAFSTPTFFDVAPDPTLACAKAGRRSR